MHGRGLKNLSRPFVVADTSLSCVPTVMAIQESKAALGKGSLEKLPPEEKRKARMTTLRDLFQIRDIEELWDEDWISD